MPEIEKRVDDLETLLGRFIVHTDIALTNLSREVDRVSKEVERVSQKVEAFHEEMRIFKEEAERDRKALHEKMERFKEEAERDRKALHEKMERFKEEAERDRKSLHEKMEAFKDEMKDFKDEMKVFKDEMKDFKDEMKVFKDEMKDFKDEMKDFKDEMKVFKDEMTDFKDEMKVFKDGMEAFRDEMREETRKKNKEWSNLAKKMGTIVEDLIAPALRPVLKSYFNCDVTLEGQRLFRRRDGETYEIDAIAACDDKVFMIEVRSTPRDRDVDEIKEKAGRFFYFFPEFKDRSLILIFGSITFPENIIRYATRSGIYVMGWREWEYMDILNFDEINKK